MSFIVSHHLSVSWRMQADGHIKLSTSFFHHSTIIELSTFFHSLVLSPKSQHGEGDETSSQYKRDLWTRLQYKVLAAYDFDDHYLN